MMVHQLRAPVALTEYPSLVPSILIRKLTVITIISGNSAPSFGFCRHLISQA